MQESLNNFFNSIGFSDSEGYFKDAYISNVILKKKQEAFEVFIESSNPINPVATLSLNKCAQKGINGKNKCHINYIYDDMSDDDILEAFKVLLGELITKRPSLVSLENKNITIDDDFIIIELDSKSEEFDILQKEIKGLSEGLIELGFYEMEITTTINKDNERKIQEEIENDRNKEIDFVYVPIQENNNNSKGWSPKKKIDYSREGLVTIESIDREENNVHLEAYIFGAEFNQLKTKDGRDLYLITLKISDDTSSILAKCFAKDEEDFAAKSKELKKGAWFSFKGQVRYDNFADDLVFNFRSYSPLENVPSFKRVDEEKEKRVELHAHTKMSQMDGVCDEVKLVKQAIEWGHRGIAITDHDCCQSFPHVNPGHHIDEQITRVTDISDDDVKDADNEENVIKRFKEWIGPLPLVAHNARFDKNMLDMAYYKYNLGNLKNPIIDTLMLSRVINRDLKRHSLAALGKFYGIDTGEADEDEENVNESVASGSVLDPEIGENFESITVDGEELIHIEKQEYTDIDLATEEKITKTRNIYHLTTAQKPRKLN